MATATGTATNYLDLLTKLRDFLTANAALVAAGQQWEVVGGLAAGAFTATDYLSLKGKGLAGTDQIFASLRTFTNAPAGRYHLKLRGHTAYDPTSPSDTPVGTNSPWVTMLSVDASIQYWFVANGRRFIVVHKANSRYDCMYVGFILPEHLPGDWSYPLFIGGSCHLEEINASDNAATHTNFWNPQSNAYMFCPSQAWQLFQNWNTSETYQTNQRVIMQWNNGLSFANKARNIDGTASIERGQLIERNIGGFKNFLGSFDGVFWVSAVGTVVEQIITANSVNHLAVPNVYRNFDNHMAAIALE